MFLNQTSGDSVFKSLCSELQKRVRGVVNSFLPHIYYSVCTSHTNKSNVMAIKRWEKGWKMTRMYRERGPAKFWHTGMSVFICTVATHDKISWQLEQVWDMLINLFTDAQHFPNEWARRLQLPLYTGIFHYYFNIMAHYINVSSVIHT